MATGPLHTVHVRVNDAATGQPTPARIRFAGPREEDYYPPFGRRAYFRDDGERFEGNVDLSFRSFACIDGTCEIPLPPGPISVEVTKGFEYVPLKREVALGPGKLSLRLGLNRWVNLQDSRWYSGDSSVFLMSPSEALLEGTAENAAVVNLLTIEKANKDQDDCYFPNIVAFSGQQPLVQVPGHLVVVNSYNCAGALGSTVLLNCHRIVYPLSAGCRSDELYDWTVADWCDQCHRKGGLVIWTDFGRQWTGGPADGYSGETLADLVLGKVDAIEMNWLDWQETPNRHEWYRLMNCGFRLPVVGGSGKDRNSVALGGLRTYARLRSGEEFTYKNWIEAIRAGRTFVSNGPLLTLTVNDQDPGAVLDLPEGTRTVRVRAEARSIVPFERLELVFNGEPLAGTEASGSPCSALLEGDVEVPGSGWLAARCWGSSPAFAAWDPENQHVAAHTSPVYLQMAEKPFLPDLMSLALLIERIDKMVAWAEKEARFDTDKRRDELLGIFQAARAELVRRSRRETASGG